MEPRNQGYAKAIMDSRPGYLRNLTEEGCKIVTVSALPHSNGEILTFQILPDETSATSDNQLALSPEANKDKGHRPTPEKPPPYPSRK